MIFHTDSAPAYAGSRPDVLGLLCLRKAVSGGESLVISGHNAYNALLETRARTGRRTLRRVLLRPLEGDRSRAKTR